MTPHTYAPGDLVKIISMEEVRKYPSGVFMDKPSHVIGRQIWTYYMNRFAGTDAVIDKVRDGSYTIAGEPMFFFSPEMIAGPAEAGIMGNSKTISGGDNPYFWNKQMSDTGPAEPPNEYTETVKAIRKKTDEVIAAGPDACKKWLAELLGMGEPDREEYAERLERFVLVLIERQQAPNTREYRKEQADNTIAYAVELLAAFDEEVKKYKI